MTLKSVSRERILEIAEQMGIEVTFDNPDDKAGIYFVNAQGEEEEFIHADDIWERIFEPVFKLKEDEL